MVSVLPYIKEYSKYIARKIKEHMASPGQTAKHYLVRILQHPAELNINLTGRVSKGYIMKSGFTNTCRNQLGQLRHLAAVHN